MCTRAIAASWPGRSAAGSSVAEVTSENAYGGQVDVCAPPQLPESVSGWLHAARTKAKAKTKTARRMRELCRAARARSTPVGRLLLFGALAGEARAAGRRDAHADAD